MNCCVAEVGHVVCDPTKAMGYEGGYAVGGEVIQSDWFTHLYCRPSSTALRSSLPLCHDGLVAAGVLQDRLPVGASALHWILRQGDLHDLQAGQAGYSVSKSHIDACICCALASSRDCTRLNQAVCREGGCEDVIHAAMNAFRSEVTLGQALMSGWFPWWPTSRYLASRSDSLLLGCSHRAGSEAFGM